MRIGELAERTGVSVRSLRYYEQQGLLAATRTAGGHREYPRAAVDRVVRIQEMFAAGLPSRVLAELLPCIHDADGSPNATATPWLTETLAAERDRIDAAIKDLYRTRAVLDKVIGAAQGVPGSEDGPVPVPVPEAETESEAAEAEADGVRRWRGA